ncbi:MAG: endonuclease domain-containing protein [Candidatus Cloacimonetes bacterium]|nr:endonuclease domain-containing protein [Candidatus Cloacimonadota bacterium]MCF7883544.1 endonuclease domain-containing protein [Candidatus Cloacimonadota bacterium]
MNSSKSIVSYRSDLKEKARENRKNMNKPERIVWYELLRNKKMKGYKFLRQKPIENYILDFYCNELKLCVEVDGITHSDKMGYDEIRTEKLKKLGIKVIRYSNIQTKKQLHDIRLDLLEKITIRETELGISSPLEGEKTRRISSQRGLN